jgi:hypothetical protein
MKARTHNAGLFYVRYALACRRGEIDPTSFSNYTHDYLKEVEPGAPQRQAKAYGTFAYPGKAALISVRYGHGLWPNMEER